MPAEEIESTHRRHVCSPIIEPRSLVERLDLEVCVGADGEERKVDVARGEGGRAFLDEVPNAQIEKPFDADVLRAFLDLGAFSLSRFAGAEPAAR